jgi:glycosyltransferase involved in cell wall biosynthesis
MASVPAPLVSVALSMRDAAPTVEAAVCSLLGQSFIDWELIVLDDGSRDRSVAAVRALTDARIQVHADGKQLGLAARLNQAIELARGRYLARMDADDIAYPDRLARQIAFMEIHPDVDLVGAAMVVFEGDGVPVGVFPSRATHAELCARPLSGFYLAHPTWLGKIEWFRRWRYDAACRKAQDQDLLLRAYSTSRFAALPDPLVGYRQDAVSIRKSALGRYYFSRAILRVARRDHRLAAGVGAVVAQFAKLGFDAFAVASGQTRTLLRHRALPLTEVQAQAWRDVWTANHPRMLAEETH